jgi:hypothetical protein
MTTSDIDNKGDIAMPLSSFLPWQRSAVAGTRRTTTPSSSSFTCRHSLGVFGRHFEKKANPCFKPAKASLHSQGSFVFRNLEQECKSSKVMPLGDGGDKANGEDDDQQQTFSFCCSNHRNNSLLSLQHSSNKRTATAVVAAAAASSSLTSSSPPTLAFPIPKMVGGAPASSFPIAGFLHLLFTPSLWGSVCCVLVLGILLAFIMTLLLFIFTLDDHADWFGGSAHWWAWVLAVLAVLLESLCLTIVILKVTHTRVQVKLFVATMRQKGRWDDRRMVTPSIVPGLCKLRFVVRLVTLPLNLIPVAGNILYAYINAPFEAKEAMDMYFDAIQLNDRQRWIEIYGSPRQACCDMYSSSYVFYYDDTYVFVVFCCFIE